MQMHESANQTRPLYESPHLTEVGSVKDLTLGGGWRGSDDTFVFTIHGHQFSIQYGELS
jgi:hypothetical protein